MVFWGCSDSPLPSDTSAEPSVPSHWSGACYLPTTHPINPLPDSSPAALPLPRNIRTQNTKEKEVLHSSTKLTKYLIWPPNLEQLTWSQQSRLQSLRKSAILTFMRRLGTSLWFSIAQCTLTRLILALLNSRCVFYQLYTISKFWKWFCVACCTYCNQGES